MGLKFGEIVIEWADGHYSFRLGLAELEEIEAKFDKSIFEIAAALGNRTAKSKEISEVLRVGLIGGGMPPADALAKVRRYCDERPLDENRTYAYGVCLKAIQRVHTDETEEDAPGETEAAIETDTDASTSPPSEELPQPTK